MVWKALIWSKTVNGAYISAVGLEGPSACLLPFLLLLPPASACLLLPSSASCLLPSFAFCLPLSPACLLPFLLPLPPAFCLPLPLTFCILLPSALLCLLPSSASCLLPSALLSPACVVSFYPLPFISPFFSMLPTWYTIM